MIRKRIKWLLHGRLHGDAETTQRGPRVMRVFRARLLQCLKEAGIQTALQPTCHAFDGTGLLSWQDKAHAVTASRNKALPAFASAIRLASLGPAALLHRGSSEKEPRCSSDHPIQWLQRIHLLWQLRLGDLSRPRQRIVQISCILADMGACSQRSSAGQCALIQSIIQHRS